MKTEYMIPQTTVIEVQAESFIADSLDTVGEITNPAAKPRNIWEEWDEEEEED